MAHNIIGGVEVPGAHPGMPIARFGIIPLAGENSALMLKKKTTGGVAGEVPIHTHASDAQAGQTAPTFRRVFLLAGM